MLRTKLFSLVQGGINRRGTFYLLKELNKNKV